MGRYGRRAASAALVALGVVGCSGGGGDAASAKAACAALDRFEDRRQFNDYPAMRRQLRNAERRADASGNDDLAGYLGEADARFDELQDFPRGSGDGISPEYLALFARLDGNLSFAKAECADAGHPVGM